MEQQLKLLEEKADRYKKLSEKGGRNAKKYQTQWSEALADMEKLNKKREQQKQDKFLTSLVCVSHKKTKKSKVAKPPPKFYCGMKEKAPKGRKLGNEAECKKTKQIRRYGKIVVTNKSGGHINKELIEMMLMESLGRPKMQKRRASGMGRKGGALSAKLLKEFISASHDEDFHDVGDYKIDRSLSKVWVKVYYNKEKNHAVVVHRGSSDVADAWTDFKLLFNQKNNKRFKTAKEVQQKAEDKYGASNVTTIGSSLGGYLAKEMGQKSKEVITISKPTTPLDVITGKKKGPRQYDIKTTRDPIASLQTFQKGQHDIIIPSKTFNPFQEHFGDKVVERLPEDLMIGQGRLKKMKVKQLKELIKIMRHGKARQYPLTKKKKGDLQKMVRELEGGSVSSVIMDKIIDFLSALQQQSQPSRY